MSEPFRPIAAQPSRPGKKGLIKVAVAVQGAT